MSFRGRFGKTAVSCRAKSFRPQDRDLSPVSQCSSQTRSSPPQKQQAQSLATAIRRLDRTILSIATISLLAADILGKTTWAQRAASDATAFRVLSGPGTSGGNRRFKGTRCRASFCRPLPRWL